MRSPTVSVQEMREHVNALALASGIAVETRHIIRLRDSFALREADGASDEISVAPIRSALSYSVALHEIGHMLGRHQASSCVMTRERWAWKWARKHAIVWTSAMERYAAKSLAWYESRHPEHCR